MLQQRSLLLTAPHTLLWSVEPLSAPQPTEILVETIAGAISIGTELPFYLGTHRGSEPITYPRMTGYESLGQVIACGPQVKTVQVGDRVVAFYGHRSHAVLSAERLIVVPAGISDKLALLAILACDVGKGIAKLNPQPTQKVLITGMGTIGLLALWMLKAYGITQVDVVEPNVERHQLAYALGASRVVTSDTVNDQIADYSIGIECSSRNAGFALLQAAAAIGGHICILADGNLEPLQLSPHFHEKELTVVGSSDGVDYPAYARWFYAQDNQQITALEALFMWTINANELPQTFRRIANSTMRPVKVFVEYTG